MKNIGIFLAIAGLLVACARQEDTGTETTQTDTNRPSVGAPAGSETGVGISRTDDAQINQAVKNAVTMGDQSKQRDIQVTVRSGVVTLKGTVANEQEKQDIESRAKAVAGVSRVDNQLEVKAESQTPARPQQGQPQQGQPRQPQQGQPQQPQPQPQ